MKSAPSTVMMLLKERMPPNEICVISSSVNVVPRLVRPVATPGVRRAKSVNSLPLTGRFWICCVLITLLISIRVVSTVGASVEDHAQAAPYIGITPTEPLATPHACGGETLRTHHCLRKLVSNEKPPFWSRTALNEVLRLA